MTTTVMSTEWQRLSVQLMQQGDLQALRTLLTKTQLDTGLSYEEVCQPSQYSWENGVFVRNDAYGLLKSVRKRLKRKRDKKAVMKANRKMSYENRAVKTKLTTTRTALAELQQNQTKSQRFFLEAQTNYCKILKKCDTYLYLGIPTSHTDHPDRPSTYATLGVPK